MVRSIDLLDTKIKYCILSVDDHKWDRWKFLLSMKIDRALYVEKLMELSNSISNEHNDETSFEINYELANTRMYCRDLEYRLKISKIMKWAFLILGMILGIIINLLV